MKKIYFLLLVFLQSFFSFGQQSIFDIIDKDDLSFSQIENLAKHFFDSAGRGEGSGFKQYERWKFERQFHLDDNGFYIKPATEQAKYLEATNLGLTQRTLSSFTELGPFSWTYTSGWNPGVGRITCIAVFPADTTIIYVSSPGGGIWKSSNSGTTWQPLVDNNSSYMNVFHLAIDPSNSSVVYAALTSGGVIKTTNGGATWAATGSGPSTSKKILIDPTNTNTIFVTSALGIHKSINGGTTWANVHNIAKEDIEFMPGNSSVLYASGSGSASVSAVYRSINGGTTWGAVTVANGITNFGRTLLGVSVANPNVVYAVQANGGNFGRLYRSTNAGATFTTTVVGNPTAGTNYFGYTGVGTTGQAGYDMGITVSPSDVNEVHIAGIVCWKSVNAGTSFTQMTIWSYPNSVGYNHADVHGLEWVGKTMYSCSDGGVFKSTDNADNWINLSVGLGIRQLYRLATSKTNANIISAGAQDNGTVARTSTGTWRDWLGADGMECIIDPNNANTFIGTSQYGNIYKTTNGGSSYSGLSRPVAGNWVTPLAWHPTNSSIVYGGWNAIYKSINAGVNWTNISTTLTTGGNLDHLKVAPSNDNFIYASRANNLFVTTNGGTSWTTYIVTGTISSIEVKYNNPSKVWITTTSGSNNVLVSTNAGATFTAINSGLPAIAARSIVVDDTPDEVIYVGMNIGVYYKSLASTAWASLATGLPQVAINEIEISKLAGQLRVATYGRGIWETPLVNSALPIKWFSFSGKRENNKVQLHWTTEGQNDNVVFTVQCSKDGVHFTSIATVNGQSTSNYAYTDIESRIGNIFYRILSTEHDQKTYSSIILIKTDKDHSYLNIVQNPVKSSLRFSVKQGMMKDFLYSIYDVNGMMLYSTKTNSSYNELNIAHLMSGVYILEVNVDGIFHKQKFVKQ
jgi:hypothetical protein